MKVLYTVKPVDHEKERGEKKRSLADFLEEYNGNLPSSFPRASVTLLQEFKRKYPSLFKGKDSWALGVHRKKVMDWLPQHIRSTLR